MGDPWSPVAEATGDPWSSVGNPQTTGTPGVSVTAAPSLIDDAKRGAGEGWNAATQAFLRDLLHPSPIAQAAPQIGASKVALDAINLPFAPVVGALRAAMLPVLQQHYPSGGEAAQNRGEHTNPLDPNRVTSAEDVADILSNAFTSILPVPVAGPARAAGKGVEMARDVAEGLATKFGPRAAKVVEEVPREVVLNPEGMFTDEGRELAEVHGVPPQTLARAYDEAEQSAATAQAAPPEAAPAPAVEPEATPTATARVAEASSEDIPLTRGQATQDFGAQDAEQTLLAQNSPEGVKARAFYDTQQTQIGEAVDRYKASIANPDLTTAERGQQVKDALRELRDQGKAGVTALYTQARESAESLGHNVENLIKLDTAPLLKRMRELFIDEAVPEATRKALKQQAAKYGLIGEAPRTVEGETTVQLRDSTGEPSGRIAFTGEPRPLTIANAEDLRKTFNQLYKPGESNAQESLKPILDDAVESAAQRAATAEGPGGVGEAFKAARAAHQTQQRTFAAKDVVEHLISWKKGTLTDEVLPEHAIRDIFAGGSEAVTNLRRIKAVLLSNPTEASAGAWKAIQAHGVADVFKASLSPRGEFSGARLNTAIKKFGMDKLRVLLDESAFNQLMKLRRVIGDATVPLKNTTNHSGSGFKVIAFLVSQGMRLGGVAKLVPGVGPIVDVATGLAKMGKESAQAADTLKGMTTFTAEDAAKADAKAAGKPAPKSQPTPKPVAAPKPTGAALVKAFTETDWDLLVRDLLRLQGQGVRNAGQLADTNRNDSRTP